MCKSKNIEMLNMNNLNFIFTPWSYFSPVRIFSHSGISHSGKLVTFAWRVGLYIRLADCRKPKTEHFYITVLIPMRMKRLFFTLLVVLMLTGMTYAQETPEHKSLFGAKVLLIDYGLPNDVEDLNLTNGLELSYIRSLGKSLNVAIPLKVGLASVPGSVNNRTFGSLDALLQLKAQGKFLTPYLFAGGGVVAADEDDPHLQIPAGGGFNFRVGNNSFVNLQGEYRYSTLENRNNIQAGLGVLFRLGKLTDTDGDGIIDTMDECPNEPGPRTAGGCPDRDGDGVADRIDLCPDLKGMAETRGCPDTDKDGFYDPEDDCPQTPGTVKGCPDRDGDGIADKDDKCPDDAGDLMGCPDTDKDGIADVDDECPEEAGPASNRGCPIPDRDGDGIPDEQDRCPDMAGGPLMQGCPDSDGDGVADMDDRCPNKPGPYSGCPDTDGDGIMDADDRCPEEAGPASNKGCPEIKEEVKQVLSTAMRAVQFETGKSILKPESFPILDQVAQVLRDYPAYHLRIKGHTDSVGDSGENQVLSENRARTCYQYLINSGISAERLSFAGFGESMPIADNKSSRGRTLNRRVEFDLFLP